MSLAAVRGPLEALLGVMDRLYTRAMIVLLGLVLAVNMLEILSRTLLDHSFYWIQEFTVVGCGYVIFLGAAALFNRRGDILISTLFDRFPARLRKALTVFNHLAILAFLCFAIKASFVYVRFISGGYTQTMKLPMVAVYLPILICFLSIGLVVLDWLLQELESPIPAGEARVDHSGF